MKEMPKRFDHQAEEPKLYQKWLASGGFAPDMSSNAEARSILMPPPNANGLLHLGHAYELGIQDAFIRYWRMRGYKTLWQAGADHAGFETQVVYERKLEKEGRTRFGMERHALYDEIFAFSKTNQGFMRQQFERLGLSCDWDRFKFMLDPSMVAVVYQTFKQLYDDGLIYRAKRPVHWCVKHQTTLSDLEVNDETRIDPLYYIQYGPLTVATVRPETIFGDVAVAVNPHDDRYHHLVGTTVSVDLGFTTLELPVIADDHAKTEFGSGAVKITPAHDPNDFAVAERHNLPIKEVIDQFGKLTEAAGPYAGMKIAEARAKIIADMEAKGLIANIEPSYSHTVKVCYKCKNIIEPRVLDQWWLALTRPSSAKGKSLKDMAVEAVESGETRFLTEQYHNQFTNWMNNLRDWPLSRQIVWGIQLPVWYTKEGDVIVTDGSEPANSHELTRDTDVFDTWFSSCQWPFSTLSTTSPQDLATFYPTTVMVTGYEILFFWVARMLMLSLYTQGQVPYRTVYIHGILRDKDRQKMSKSKGNVIDPLEISQEYGTDALRIALMYGTAPGTDPTISEEKIRGMRNFTTKIWNIGRYVAMSIDDTTKPEFIAHTDADHEIHKKLLACMLAVTKAINDYDLHLALESLYQFVWHDLADVYIEATKAQLTDDATKLTTQGNLMFIFDDVLRLMHPFAPFVTEGLWQELMASPECLMNQAWPVAG